MRRDPGLVRRRFLADVRMLRRLREWKPYLFAATGPLMRGRTPAGSLEFSYRSEHVLPEAHVRVDGGAASWRKRVEAELAAHGYAKQALWGMVRRLRDPRDAQEELAWLASFRGVRLPPRDAPRDRSGASFQRQPIWGDVDRARSTDIRWTWHALGLIRRATFGPWRAVASILVVVEPDGEVDRSLHVQLFTHTDRIERRAVGPLARMLESFPRGYDRRVFNPTPLFFSRNTSTRATLVRAQRELDAWLRASDFVHEKER